MSSTSANIDFKFTVLNNIVDNIAYLAILNAQDNNK